MKKKLVVLTGAGISAESGLKTFRDADGLWEGHDVMEVATPEAWNRDSNLVQKFYNERRSALKSVVPNKAHKILAELEDFFDVTIITQNVDDLHERAGSSKILHLHGELLKVRSTGNQYLIYDWTEDVTENDLCEEGHPLRPHIVWFGEPVPMIEEAAKIAADADIFVVIGTSLVVYPAAGLIQYTSNKTPVYLIDPQKSVYIRRGNVHHIVENATTGAEKLKSILLEEYR